MATYSMNDYTLSLEYVDSAFALKVVNNDTNESESFDLRVPGESVTLKVLDGEYVIGEGSTIQDDEEPNKLMMGGSNSQNFAMRLLTGIGIMDLRDMGRQGQLTVEYDLECCEIRLEGKDNAYPLWIKASTTSCIKVTPEE